MRPFVDIEGYPQNTALVLIKNTLNRWLQENPGFCILIGGPAARGQDTQTIKYYVRCFGEIGFRNSGHSCIIDAACKDMYLLLGDSKASYLSSRFIEVARRASRHLRPNDAGKPEIGDFISVGHLEPVLQGLGGELSIRNVKNISLHGHREPPHIRFNWLFERRIHE